jgi:hypothetical protein
MAEKVENFIQRFMEKQEMSIHYGVFHSEFVQELDEAIEKGPHATRKFYQDLPEDFSRILDIDGLGEITEEIDQRDRTYLTEDDQKIIEFFSNEATQPGIKEIVDITGVMINVLGLLDELELRSYCITANIESTAYFWVYLNVYELILDTLSKNLLRYYKEEDIRENSRQELEEKIEDGDHFSSGKIQNQLSGLDVIEHENNSIFSKNRARAMRNSLGHANVFYDDAKGDIVFSNGERYSFQEFKREFEVIFQFALEWAYQLNNQDANVDKQIVEAFRKMSKEVDRSLLKFARSDGDWEKVLLQILDE